MILTGDALKILLTLDAESVQCCVTSPPYWNLRDYGVDGQIGLEATHLEYVEKLVRVFREVWRVLRPDGTLWLNLGDSYASGKGTCYNPGGGESSLGNTTNPGKNKKQAGAYPLDRGNKSTLEAVGLKPKDLIGIPWRVAFALQADGWWLRQDIIWSKPNPMPESVTDRCTKAHEYIFLLAKGQWKSRVVALSDLHGERVHLGQNFGLESPDSGAVAISIGLASAILNCPEFQQEFGLVTFDPQIWKQRLSDSSGNDIGSLPVHCRTAVLAAGLLNSDRSPKEFLSELYRLGVTLADGNNFLIGGIDTKFPLPPSINSYGKTAIAIHDSGKICQFDFLHGTIIHQSPSGCKYFYDAEAVKEPSQDKAGRVIPDGHRSSWKMGDKTGRIVDRDGKSDGCPIGGRNRRSVWTITTKPFKEAHFATFPPEIPEICIKAGTSKRGCCPECGSPWERVVVKERTATRPGLNSKFGSQENDIRCSGSETSGLLKRVLVESTTTGWRPTCTHDLEPIPCTVLDPFSGAGTTGNVAERLGRKYIGIELNPAYSEMGEKRIEAVRLPLFGGAP